MKTPCTTRQSKVQLSHDGITLSKTWYRIDTFFLKRDRGVLGYVL